MAEKSASGIQFPLDSKGARSTTAVAKAIWSAVAKDLDSELAQRISGEKDWRHQYPFHLGKIGVLANRSKANQLAIAQKGLEAVYSTFTFIRDGETLPVLDAMARFKSGTFATGTVQGTGPKDASLEAEMPYKSEILKGAELEAKLQEWATYGTIEASAAAAVGKVISAGEKWMDLTGQTFVLLGAGSELGPLKFLLRRGATVVAIRTRKPKAWKETVEFAKSTPGTLIFPYAEQGEGEPEDRAGCDLMEETPEIRNWLLSVLKPGQKAMVGCYTYLDSDAHVRVSIACDAIMAELAEQHGCHLAFIATPAVDIRLPEGCRAAMDENRANSPMWMKWTRCSLPRTTEVETEGGGVAQILHAFIVAQGPNYALAKTLQNWRAILAREQGTMVSANVGPPSRTESVVHNKTLEKVLDGSGYIRPNECFDAETASALMALLLVHDLRNEGNCAAWPQMPLQHPMELFAEAAVHGGSWRTGFDVEASTVFGAAVYSLGALAPIR